MEKGLQHDSTQLGVLSHSCSLSLASAHACGKIRKQQAGPGVCRRLEQSSSQLVASSGLSGVSWSEWAVCSQLQGQQPNSQSATQERLLRCGRRACVHACVRTAVNSSTGCALWIGDSRTAGHGGLGVGWGQ